MRLTNMLKPVRPLPPVPADYLKRLADAKAEIVAAPAPAPAPETSDEEIEYDEEGRRLITRPLQPLPKRVPTIMAPPPVPPTKMLPPPLTGRMAPSPGAGRPTSPEPWWI